jgi:hypothetical protein
MSFMEIINIVILLLDQKESTEANNLITFYPGTFIFVSRPSPTSAVPIGLSLTTLWASNGTYTLFTFRALAITLNLTSWPVKSVVY